MLQNPKLTSCKIAPATGIKWVFQFACVSARLPVGHIFGADEARADAANPAAAAAPAATIAASRLGRGGGADAAGGLGRGRGEGGGEGRGGGHLGLPEEGHREIRPHEERRGSFVNSET